MHSSIQFGKKKRSEVCHKIFGEAFQRMAKRIRRHGSRKPDVGGSAGPNESANNVCVRVRLKKPQTEWWLVDFCMGSKGCAWDAGLTYL